MKAEGALYVPVITRKKATVPPALQKLIDGRFQIGGRKIPLCTDFDDTLLPTPTMPEKRLTLKQSVAEPPLLGVMHQGVRFRIISNSDGREIERRFTNPLREILGVHSELSLMAGVKIYSNGGAVKSAFNDKGELDVAGGQEYQRQFLIPQSDERDLQELLAEAGHAYWRRYLENAITMRGEYPTFPFKEPTATTQGGVKMVLYPLPPKERAVALRFIRERLKDERVAALGGKYQIKPGGKSTIDVYRAGLSKGSALRDTLIEEGIPLEEGYPVVFFADGFYIRSDEFGESHIGEDMAVLEVPNVVPIAVNRDQTELQGLPDRIIAGGSGTEATLEWLSYIHRQLDKAA